MTKITFEKILGKIVWTIELEYVMNQEKGWNKLIKNHTEKEELCEGFSTIGGGRIDASGRERPENFFQNIFP